MSRLTASRRLTGIATRPSRGANRAQKTASPRRRPAPRALRWVLFGGAGLLAAGAVSTVIWAFTSGWVSDTVDAAVERTLAMTVDAGLGVRNVLVTGRERTPGADILAALDVDTGAPILAFDPEEARDAVAALPWVRNVVIERRFPDTIYLRLEERRPLALWQSDRSMRVIDADGVVLTENGLEDYAALPLVVGLGAPDHAGPLLEKLAARPAIAERVEAAILVSERRWDLRLDNGVNVRLPEKGIDEALLRLSEIEANNGLLDRDIVSIDLRIGDRLVVQTTPGASQRRRLPEEDT